MQMAENYSLCLLRPPLPPEDDPLMFDHLINSIAIPLVCIPGVFATIICMTVFSRPQMRSTLNVYLAGLSLFDLLLLAMSLLIYPPMSLCMRTGNLSICRFFWRTALVTFPVSLASQTASVWTCVAITVDRFMAVQYPLKTRIVCTPNKAALILIIIASLSFLYKMPSVFEVRLNECGRLEASELRKNELYITIYNTYGYLLLLIAIPWSIMIIFNVIVVRAVHQAYHKRQSLTKSKGRVDDKERRCTIMALVMLTTFILFNMLAGVNNIVEAFFKEYEDYYRERIAIGNLLVCINSASNILIYSIFGRKFRRICMKMFCPCIDTRGYLWLAPTIANQSELEYRKNSSPSRRGSSLKSTKKVTETEMIPKYSHASSLTR
ncbi:unnamed protein product [Bursaphelenchus okinawaensis]|uniref:G-protein coupled receptors family 1 profile domain-containing protein n=1 Tax=Bursaphelenchus okinawaensis TaxID=465554 RepID=A0A811KVK2_9BILA|nr:unnamed protein product [Bursaphelenchus okinawaensis]CAG9112953.1 unnamed protein product [Bursaphelenchus okinawaensis]